MENNIEERTMDCQTTVVVNETQLPESVHEEADPRPSCAHHLREGLLTDLGNYSFLCCCQHRKLNVTSRTMWIGLLGHAV